MADLATAIFGNGNVYDVKTEVFRRILQLL